MSRRLSLAAALVVTLLLFVPGRAAAAGHTADQLVAAGYTCFPAGPSDWIHCMKEQHAGQPSIPFKVFSEDGSQFLGTEQLLRADIYNDQGCPQDGLELWEDLSGEGLPYFACHHFFTGHH